MQQQLGLIVRRSRASELGDARSDNLPSTWLGKRRPVAGRSSPGHEIGDASEYGRCMTDVCRIEAVLETVDETRAQSERLRAIWPLRREAGEEPG